MISLKYTKNHQHKCIKHDTCYRADTEQVGGADRERRKYGVGAIRIQNCDKRAALIG